VQQKIALLFLRCYNDVIT